MMNSGYNRLERNGETNYMGLMAPPPLTCMLVRSTSEISFKLVGSCCCCCFFLASGFHISKANLFKRLFWAQRNCFEHILAHIWSSGWQSNGIQATVLLLLLLLLMYWQTNKQTNTQINIQANVYVLNLPTIYSAQ